MLSLHMILSTSTAPPHTPCVATSLAIGLRTIPLMPGRLQFEQYIRDLAIFGTNTIEIIPPRSDDDAISPLYTLQPMPMMVKLSEIINRYGLDCSIWYPALDKDYSD